MKLLAEYSPETTGYTNDHMIALRSRFKKCDFKLIMTHIVVDAVAKHGKEYDGDTIMHMVENDELNRPPLQPNTVYMYCKIGSLTPTASICTVLSNGADSATPQAIRLPSLLFFENDYNSEERIPIRKDIVIMSDGDKELGWYNIQANILWVSDLGHYKEYVLDRLTRVLDQIYEFKISGEIPVLPNLTIGIDPEFEVYSSDLMNLNEAANKFIPASALVHDPDRRLEIGHNGHAETGEIRPIHSNHPLKLARNIKRTLRKLFRHPSFEDYAICVGGGLRKELGGHIHFNLEAFPNRLIMILYDLIANPMRLSMNDNSPRKLGNRMVRANADEPIRRAAHGVIEWRVLPSFILNDEICKAVLCTTWIVVKAFHKGELTKENYNLDVVANTLKSISFYKIYKPYVDDFIRLFLFNRTEMEAKNIRRTWNIIAPEVASNIKIRSNIKWVSKYFTPLSVDTNKKITVGIFFTENHMLSTCGKNIKPEILDSIEEFCGKHFTNYEHKDSPPRNKQCDFEIYFPWMWANLNKEKDAFKELRKFVQDLILALLQSN